MPQQTTDHPCWHPLADTHLLLQVAHAVQVGAHLPGRRQPLSQSQRGRLAAPMVAILGWGPAATDPANLPTNGHPGSAVAGTTPTGGSPAAHVQLVGSRPNTAADGGGIGDDHANLVEQAYLAGLHGTEPPDARGEVEKRVVAGWYAAGQRAPARPEPGPAEDPPAAVAEWRQREGRVVEDCKRKLYGTPGPAPIDVDGPPEHDPGS